MWIRSAMTIAVAAALVFGCAGGGAAPPDAAAPPAYSGPMSAELKPILDAALADAARRTGRDKATLQVVSAAAVTWADGSLGCPRPGQSYTMALVPGYRIEIRAGAEVLEYHASSRGYLVLCPSGRSAPPQLLETK